MINTSKDILRHFETLQDEILVITEIYAHPWVY